jgi:hypothetical protein
MDRRLIRGWAIAQGVLGLAFFLVSVLTPSAAGRAVVFGLSWARLAMGMVFLLAAIAPAVLVIRLGRADSDTWSHIGMHVTLQRWRYLVAAWALMAVGLMIVTIRAAGAVEAIAPLVSRLQPVAGWLFLTGTGMAAAVLSVARIRGDVLAFGVLVAVTLTGVAGHTLIWPAEESMVDDIYYVFREGGTLRAGVNPYERILEAPGEEVRKPPAYLPPIYYISAGIQSLGFDGFSEWVAVWRVVSLSSVVVIAAALFLYGHTSQQLLLGIIGALLWMFNRWTLRVSQSADMDFLPVAFLVLALIYLTRGSKRSLLLLGISLAIKHLAILLTPIFLITLWRSRQRSIKKSFLLDLLLVGAVPMAFSLPFLIANADSFLRSISYSLTRNPQASGQVVAIDGLLGWEGLAARLPMFGLVLVAYAGHLQARWRPLTTCLLVIAIVILLNSVFFTSYMTWLVPLIPLAAVEALSTVGGDAERISP